MGEPGAVVRGGIVVTADGVTIRDVSVVGGEHGIEVDGAQRVVLERVKVSGAALDGINVRRSSVKIRDCLVQATGEYAQGIDISFGFDLEPSVVEGCTVHGGREGIVTHFAHARVADNRVSGTSLRGITLTEMSMAEVEENQVEGALGVGIFCGDYSMCEIEENSVSGTRPDLVVRNLTRLGYGIVAHYGADATLADNRLHGNARRVGSFLRASISARVESLPGIRPKPDLRRKQWRERRSWCATTAARKSAKAKARHLRLTYADARRGAKAADLCDDCAGKMPGHPAARRGRRPKAAA